MRIKCKRFADAIISRFDMNEKMFLRFFPLHSFCSFAFEHVCRGAFFAHWIGCTRSSAPKRFGSNLSRTGDFSRSYTICVCSIFVQSSLSHRESKWNGLIRLIFTSNAHYSKHTHAHTCEWLFNPNKNDKLSRWAMVCGNFVWCHWCKCTISAEAQFAPNSTIVTSITL